MNEEISPLDLRKFTTDSLVSELYGTALDVMLLKMFISIKAVDAWTPELSDVVESFYRTVYQRLHSGKPVVLEEYVTLARHLNVVGALLERKKNKELADKVNFLGGIVCDTLQSNRVVAKRGPIKPFWQRPEVLLG